MVQRKQPRESDDEATGCMHGDFLSFSRPDRRRGHIVLGEGQRAGAWHEWCCWRRLAPDSGDHLQLRRSARRILGSTSALLATDADDAAGNTAKASDVWDATDSDAGGAAESSDVAGADLGKSDAAYACAGAGATPACQNYGKPSAGANCQLAAAAASPMDTAGQTAPERVAYSNSSTISVATPIASGAPPVANSAAGVTDTAPNVSDMS